MSDVVKEKYQPDPRSIAEAKADSQEFLNEAENPETGSLADALSSGYLNAITLGFADEIANAVSGGDEADLADLRQYQNKVEETHPMSSALGQGVGTGLQALALGKLLPGGAVGAAAMGSEAPVAALGQFGARLPKSLPLVERLLPGAGLATLGGATYGAGEAEGPQGQSTETVDLIKKVLLGAGAGLVGGLTLPPLLGAAGRGIQKAGEVIGQVKTMAGGPSDWSKILAAAQRRALEVLRGQSRETVSEAFPSVGMKPDEAAKAIDPDRIAALDKQIERLAEDFARQQKEFEVIKKSQLTPIEDAEKKLAKLREAAEEELPVDEEALEAISSPQAMARKLERDGVLSPQTVEDRMIKQLMLDDVGVTLGQGEPVTSLDEIPVGPLKDIELEPFVLRVEDWSPVSMKNTPLHRAILETEAQLERETQRLNGFTELAQDLLTHRRMQHGPEKEALGKKISSSPILPEREMGTTPAAIEEWANFHGPTFVRRFNEVYGRLNRLRRASEMEWRGPPGNDHISSEQRFGMMSPEAVELLAQPEVRLLHQKARDAAAHRSKTIADETAAMEAAQQKTMEDYLERVARARAEQEALSAEVARMKADPRTSKAVARQQTLSETESKLAELRAERAKSDKLLREIALESGLSPEEVIALARAHASKKKR